MGHFWKGFAGTIAFAGAVLTAGSARACSADDIKIKSFNYRITAPGFVAYVGEIVNGCSEATGVKLQIVTRSSSGEAVGSEEFWPASISNIAAGSSRVFQFTTMWNAQTKTASMNVIDVKQW